MTASRSSRAVDLGSEWAQQGSNLRPLGEQPHVYGECNNHTDQADQGSGVYPDVPGGTEFTDNNRTADHDPPAVPVGSADTTQPDPNLDQLRRDLTKAAREAQRLANDLRDIADGDGSAASALTNIDRLAALKPRLEVLHQKHLADQIGTAAGNAAAHAWQATTTNLACTRCGCTALPYMLRYGQTPQCGDICLSPLGPSHGLTSVFDDHTYSREGTVRCSYCKTVYPVTAPAAESERVR